MKPEEILQLGNRIRRFDEHCDWLTSLPVGYQNLEAHALAAAAQHAVFVLAELGRVNDIKRILDNFDRTRESLQAAEREGQERRREAYAAAVERAKRAINHPCPTCGSGPGEKCRTSSGASKGVHVHASRGAA